MSEKGPSQEQAVLFARGQDAQLILSYLEEWVARRKSMIEKRIYAAMESGDPIDPNLALQSWAEHRAVHKLRADLEREVSRGAKAGESIEDSGG